MIGVVSREEWMRRKQTERQSVCPTYLERLQDESGGHRKRPHYGSLIALICRKTGYAQTTVYNVLTGYMQNWRIQKELDAYFARLNATNEMALLFPHFSAELYQVCHKILGHRCRVHPPTVEE
jgi:hypothetical protein